jgi:hypothetical protein
MFLKSSLEARDHYSMFFSFVDDGSLKVSTYDLYRTIESDDLDLEGKCLREGEVIDRSIKNLPRK